MNMNRAREVTYFLLRVVAGFMFFQAGSMILFGWFGGRRGPPGSTPPLMSELGIGGGLEFLGGLAILLGAPWCRTGHPPTCTSLRSRTVA